VYLHAKQSCSQCNREHNNFAVLSKTILNPTQVQSGSSVYCWHFLTGEGWGKIPQAAKTNAALWSLPRVMDSLVLQ
jgi:hypothetical protein